MHAIFFHLKRGFHVWHSYGKRMLQGIGLTPSRFDMLYHARGPYIFQRDLRKVLGVSEATVSRMLTSLEKLGLVARELCRGDSRMRVVRLTPEGRRRVERVEYELISSNHIETCVVSCLAARMFGTHYGQHLVVAFEDALHNLRHQLGDTSRCFYDSYQLD